jgi:hypothetical protein
MLTSCHSHVMSQLSLLFPRRRQRRHVTKQRQRQRHNDNDTTSQDKRQRQQRLVGMEGPGGEGGYGQVVGPRALFGPGMFKFSFLLRLYIFIVYASTGPRTHPRFKSESVGRITTHEPHPRYKCESVGFSSIIQHMDPPSLQTRVGWPFLCSQTPPSL